MRISQCDMSFQGLYPNKTGVVSGANWNLEEHFGSNKKSPQNDLISVLLHIFLGKMILRLRKISKLHPSVELTNRPWVWKSYISGLVLRISGWWQLKYFLFSPWFGEDSHFDEHIFQMGGWLHQLDLDFWIYSAPFLCLASLPRCWLLPAFLKVLDLPKVLDPRNIKDIRIQGVLTITPRKFNMAPEKWWLEDEFPFGIAYF